MPEAADAGGCAVLNYFPEPPEPLAAIAFR
jgi:hypothetical protein